MACASGVFLCYVQANNRADQKEMQMKPKERVLAALQHREPDRVPTGENDIDFVLVEQLLGRPTLYNARWRERTALWDGRRAEIVADYQRTQVELVHALEWDYVRVPTMPIAKEYHWWPRRRCAMPFNMPRREADW
jgi:hypothetical protein